MEDAGAWIAGHFLVEWNFNMAFITIRVDKIDIVTCNHEDLMMKLSEITAQLTEIDAKLTEARDEIIAKIAALEGLIADADIPAEAADLIADIRTKAGALADIVPNE